MKILIIYKSPTAGGGVVAVGVGVSVAVGVAVGGGAISGKPLVSPSTVAYFPHSQQVIEPFLIIQYGGVIEVYFPTTYAFSPTNKAVM